MFGVMLIAGGAPVARVGGLVAVVFVVTRELELLGKAAEIILPKYDCVRHAQFRSLGGM